MAKRFSKKYGNKDDLSTTYNLNKSYVKMPRSAPDATSLHHCLKKKKLNLICFHGKYPNIYYCVQFRRVWLMLV